MDNTQSQSEVPYVAFDGAMSLEDLMAAINAAVGHKTGEPDQYPQYDPETARAIWTDEIAAYYVLINVVSAHLYDRVLNDPRTHNDPHCREMLTMAADSAVDAQQFVAPFITGTLDERERVGIAYADLMESLYGLKSTEVSDDQTYSTKGVPSYARVLSAVRRLHRNLGQGVDATAAGAAAGDEDESAA